MTTCRPGYGVSTRQPGRSVADVAADTVAVLDHVGVETCLTAGWSGGGPHALACGALLPERVRAVLVIAGVAPYDAAGLDFLAGMGPENVEEFEAALAGEATLRAGPRGAAADARSDLSRGRRRVPRWPGASVDVASLTGELAECLADEFRQASPHGVDGWLDDDLAFTRPGGSSSPHRASRPTSGRAART